jgi:hypothetical protein
MVSLALAAPWGHCLNAAVCTLEYLAIACQMPKSSGDIHSGQASGFLEATDTPKRMTVQNVSDEREAKMLPFWMSFNSSTDRSASLVGELVLYHLLNPQWVRLVVDGSGWELDVVVPRPAGNVTCCSHPNPIVLVLIEIYAYSDSQVVSL